MKRLVLNDVLYGDALTTGEYAAGGYSRAVVTTHLGEFPAPYPQLMFNRITNVNGFKIASKAPVNDPLGRVDRLWEYSAGSWRNTGKLSYGVQGHIYRPDGTLFLIQPGPDQESQGVRYWDNGPILGSPTYNPLTEFARAKGVTKLFGWTQLGDDLFVGQADEEKAALIQFADQHYLLEVGNCQFIQGHRVGDNLVIAMTKLPEHRVVIYWLTVQEIKTLLLWGEEPVVNAPKGTIVSYPTEVKPNEKAKAVWAKDLTSGPITSIHWWYKRQGSSTWIDATPNGNSPSDPDHHYVFSVEGKYDIELEMIGPGGRDRTSKVRTITVKAATPVPVPPDPTPVPPDPGPTPPPTSARAGIVRGNTFQFVDGTGGWLPWGTSLFWGLYGFLHEHERVEQHLNWIREHGADFVRVMCTGLRRGTEERSLSPRHPQFAAAISGLSDLARSKGLRVQWTIFGATYDAPSAADRRAAIDKVCNALKGRETAVWMLEVANEGWANGFEGDSGAKELKDLAGRIKTNLPAVLVSTTCPHSTDDITADQIRLYYENSAATCQVHHYSRSTKAPDGIWRPTRKPWRESKFSVSGCCKLVQNNEPRGPKSSVSETNDPVVLAMDAATSWLCGVGSYVFHTGAGIYGLKDPSRGRPANIWETERITEICAALRNVQFLLPASLPNWTKHQSNASTAPFGFVDVPEEQFTLAYSATSGKGVVQVIGGVVKATTFTLRSGSCIGRVYHPVTGKVLEEFTKSFHVSPSQPGVIVEAVLN